MKFSEFYKVLDHFNILSEENQIIIWENEPDEIFVEPMKYGVCPFCYDNKVILSKLHILKRSIDVGNSIGICPECGATIIYRIQDYDCKFGLALNFRLNRMIKFPVVGFELFINKTKMNEDEVNEIMKKKRPEFYRIEHNNKIGKEIKENGCVIIKGGDKYEI